MDEHDLGKALQQQVLDAFEKENPLNITGSGSKSFLGHVPHGQTIDVFKHRGIVNYDPRELVLTARSGTPLSKIEATLADAGQILAFEPPHFGNQATLGGTIACALSGPRRPYSGSARDFVLGCQILNGRGEILRFGGQVMKNVAGYDVSRLMPGSLGTLGLLLEASVKVLPKPEATASLRCHLTQAEALQALNQWAGQPLPLAASSWIGECASGKQGELTIRLSGAVAAVHSAISFMNATIHSKTLDAEIANAFWSQLREQKMPFFDNLTEDQTLYRLALPAACSTLDIPQMDGDLVLEWHGQQRWLKGSGDDATFLALKSLASAHGGHATRFRQGAAIDPSHQRFTLLSEQVHTNALEAIQTRLRAAFDPAGVFATNRLS